MKFIDMHCDTISVLHNQVQYGNYYQLRENSLHMDLMKMKQAGYQAQNFAIFVAKTKDNNPLEDALQMIDVFYEQLALNSDLIAYAGSYEDLLRNEANGKMSAFLTLEEGAMIKGSLSYLRTLYRLGARMMTLTWNYENELASPNTNYTVSSHPKETVPFTTWGLTERGFETIAEMESLGMLIDVSHLSDAGFYDVLRATKKPFVASHSNARAVCSHVRNLTDDMIRELSNRGGVMGMNFYPGFLSTSSNECEYKGTIADIVAHIKHIEQVGGIECIGLGSDFDGIPGHEELSDASKMPLLCEALHQAGFSYDRIDKICYENVLRVYKDVLK